MTSKIYYYFVSYCYHHTNRSIHFGMATIPSDKLLEHSYQITDISHQIAKDLEATKVIILNYQLMRIEIVDV